MSRPYMIQDSEEWLSKASPLQATRSAVVTYRGKQVARLFAEPGVNLRDRAEHFALAAGYHGASISYAAG